MKGYAPPADDESGRREVSDGTATGRQSESPADLLSGLLDARDELARRGANGRRAYEQHYTRAHAVEKYFKVLA